MEPRPEIPAAAAPTGGRVLVQARWSASRRCLEAVGATAERPAADRLLVGKTPAAALALVPLLYSLCGKAQTAVAQAALGAAAAGRRCEVDGAALRREAIAEHLWRLLVDWPDNLQKNPDHAAFARWHRRLAAGEPSAAERAELAALVAGPLAERVEAMALVLAADPVRPQPQRLPALTPEQLATAFGAADAPFARRPTWQGGPAETGALARQLPAEATLAGRLCARWQDLRQLVAALAGPAPAVVGVALPEGGGIAGGETARGLLLHRARVADGKVASYLVVAPTEWNFHPAGAWLAALAGTAAETPEMAENLLSRWVLALDPCVPARIEIIEED